jgi:hypothetical protein
VRILLDTGCLPVEGWDDVSVEWLLRELCLLDSNNFLNNVGAGEVRACAPGAAGLTRALRRASARRACSPTW